MEAQGNRYLTAEAGRHLTRATIFVLLLIGLALISATAARDASAKGLQPCGDVVKRAPAKDDVPGLPPLVIGDSIAGWAVSELNAVGFRTNTQNCRTFAGGLKELKQLRERNKVPEFVIFNVGTGGPLKAKQLRSASRLVGAKRTLGLVTPREFKPGFGERKRKLIKAAAERRSNTLLIDWDEASRGHDDWFHWDNLHPVGEGCRALATLFAIAADHAGAELDPVGF